MAEEIINIQIVEQVDNINITIDEVVENVSISIQEPSQTSDLVNNGSDGVHPFITAANIPAVNDATTTVKGIIKLAGDLSGTADLPTIPALSGKVDKVTGKGLSTNDYTTAEQTKLDGIATGAEVNVNADWNATTGDAQILNKPTIPASQVNSDWNATSGVAQILNKPTIPSTTNLVPYTGATSDVDLGTKNLKVNNVFEGFTSVTASGTQIVLTVNSTPSYLVTGSGGQTIKLPNATTLQNGAIFDFNNNQSSGAISVNNNSNTLVKSIPSGGYLVLTLIDNSTAAGSWDAHFQAPSNVSWSTNTFDVPASITSATWNGVSIADNRIASATTWNAKEDSSNKLTTFTGNETSTTKFPVVKAILDYFTSANIKTILGITTLSGSNTGDQDLSGYVPTTRTINAKQLNANVTLTTADIADSTGKRYQTENQNSYNDATSSIQNQLNSRFLGIHTLKTLSSGQSTTVSITTASLTTVAGVSNRMSLYPYIPNVSFTCSSLYMNVTVLLASANARILIYSDLNGVPNTKLYESGNLDCSTASIKTTSTGFSFVAGTTYWLCVHSQSTPTYTAYSAGQLMPISAIGTALYFGYNTTQTFGSAPTNITSPTITNTAPPFIGINF